MSSAGDGGLMDVDVLVVESNKEQQEQIFLALPAKWVSVTVGTPEEAEGVLNARTVKVLVCSDELPDETGLMFLARTKERWPRLRRILLAADLDGELFFHAMREVSIFDYLTKPVVPSELSTAVARARMQYDAAARLVRGADEEESPAFLSPGIASPVKSWPRDGAFVVCGFVAGVFATLVSLMFLYLIKTQSGVDLYPMIHLWELFEP